MLSFFGCSKWEGKKKRSWVRVTTKSSLNCGAAHRFTLHAVSRIELTVMLCLHLSSHPTGSSCLYSPSPFYPLSLSCFLSFNVFPITSWVYQSTPVWNPPDLFLSTFHTTHNLPSQPQNPKTPPFDMSDGMPPCSLEPSSRNKSWAPPTSRKD